MALLVAALFMALVAPAWCADAPAKPAIEILQPATGATLEGVVEVRARVTPDTESASALYAGFNAAPWYPMSRVEKTNEWTCRINTSLSANGPATLQVFGRTSTVKKLSQSVKVDLQNGYSAYIGDFHGHTYYSDGTLLPADAHKYARETAKLDFFVLMDHLESMDEAEWADYRQQAWKANEDGKFACFPGLEWTKGLGHACLYDPPTRVWPKDKDGFFQAVVDAGIFCKINHPGDGKRVFDGLAYSEVGDKAVELMEVRNANEEAAYIRALQLGWHLSADGSSDTHSPNWGNTNTWTGVIAPGKSQRNLWDALKSRHTYSTHDRNCKLFFWINGTQMGDIIEQPALQVRAEVLVSDPDEQDTIAKIELYEDGTVVQTAEPKATEYRWQTLADPKPGNHFYFVRVTQTDGQMMWSAPVWVTTATVPAQ